MFALFRNLACQEKSRPLKAGKRNKTKQKGSNLNPSYLEDTAEVKIMKHWLSVSG